MEGLLLLCLIQIFIIGFLVIRKAESAIAKEKNTVYAKQKRSQLLVIIFGDNQLSRKFSSFLEKGGIDYCRFEDYRRGYGEQGVRCLIAISDSDIDNLAICSYAKKMLNIKNTITMCNSKENRDFFKQNGTNYLYGNEATAERLYFEVGKYCSLDRNKTFLLK